MNFKCHINLNILFYLFLLIPKTSFGQGCSSNNINCISCTEYQNCSDGLPEGRVVSCKIGEICADNHLKQCQIKLNCYALNECTQAGIFPDVTVDSNYYVCLNDASSGFLKYDFTCPEGNFFDEASLTCMPREVTLATTEVANSSSLSTDLTSPSDPTSSTSPSDPTSSTSPSDPTSSTSPSDPTSSTSPSDPTSSTSPSDPTSSTSPSDPTSSTSPSDPTSSTSPSDPTSSISPPDPTSSTSPSPSVPTSSTSSTTPTEPNPTAIPFACMASGIFPNPGNCKMYYRCSTSLKAFFYICPGNSYFNENILKCSMIITPACQEQILKNSTSTLSPTSPPVTTTTITTTTFKPITTSSTSTTTTTTPSSPTTITTTPAATTITTTTPFSSTPFSCPMTGIFANPLDCKIYYRCTLSGKIFQYICPGNTYFNEFTKRCSLIITPQCRNLIQG